MGRRSPRATHVGTSCLSGTGRPSMSSPRKFRRRFLSFPFRLEALVGIQAARGEFARGQGTFSLAGFWSIEGEGRVRDGGRGEAGKARAGGVMTERLDRPGKQTRRGKGARRKGE